jgi:hypothetical protein
MCWPSWWRDGWTIYHNSRLGHQQQQRNSNSQQHCNRSNSQQLRLPHQQQQSRQRGHPALCSSMQQACRSSWRHSSNSSSSRLQVSKQPL